MADAKISDLADGGALGTADQLIVARSGANKKILGSRFGQKLYDYEVAGADKASIDTNVDGTTVASFAGYDILEVWLILRTDEAVVFSTCALQFNNDAGANYDYEIVRGTNATAAALSNQALTSLQLPAAHGANARAATPSIHRMTIPGYASTVFEKVCELTTASPDSTAANNIAETEAGHWRSTAAITRIAISVVTAGKKLKVGSRLIVYGR